MEPLPSLPASGPDPSEMTLGSLHLVDLLVLVAYLVVVIYFGHRASKASTDGEGFFLAGRKLGKLYQFLLNFGNSTDANGAVSTASLVYQQGVSGVWLSLQTLFMNPYYWFMNLWFRRVRLMTVADLFEDRLGSPGLARFYAIFQIMASVVVTLGFGNLISYKISASLMVKPEASWTAAERQSVDGYQEMKGLEKQAKAASLAPEQKARLDALHDANARGELRSYITALEPWVFYLFYTLIVGTYVVMGGMTATAMNEALQGVLTVIFSILLIPLGLAAIGGWSQLGEKVPDEMFALFGSAASNVTGWTVLAILFVSVVQIHGIIGNMAVSGSAKDEYAARFGAVSGTYAKRIMIVMWAFTGLIAIAMYQGANSLSDPDETWGIMSRQLLAPGLLGLMLIGLLANNMDTVAAQTMAIAGLFVRNVYRYVKPNLTDREGVAAGRWAIVVALGIGIIAAMQMTSVFSVVQLLLTVNVPFGAAVVLIFVWRRLTPAAVWTAVILSALVNIIAPLVVPLRSELRQHPALIEQTAPNAVGRRDAVFFESVVRTRPEDPASPLEGRGRFHLELFLLDRVGIEMSQRSAAARFAARFFFDGLFPFALLILVSTFTRQPDKGLVDQFYGKMKTPVGATPELEQVAMADTIRNPHRYDHRKLFPGTAWEFTKWDRVDTVGFLVCCALSGAILAIFALLLKLAV
jgi:solute:Na+ symporter, SSS family